MSAIELKIDGQRYGGWTSAEVTIGIEQLAGSFRMSCSDRWALQGQPLPLLPGKPCTLTVDGVTVITGFIDSADVSYDGQAHSLSFSGRDATGDLVDSAATVDGQGWKGRSLRQVANDLCRPFGIPVQIAADIGNVYSADVFRKRAATPGAMPPPYDQPFAKCQINPGETVFEVLSRAARLRGCLLVSDGVGGLLITTAGSARAARPLTLGKDILRASVTNSIAERYHTYKVLAQSNEAVDAGGTRAQQVAAVAVDAEIRAGRVTIIDPIDEANDATAKRLAQWARSNRRARGLRGEFTTRGWLDGARPWRPNTLVTVTDRLSRFSGDYLIASVTFYLDEGGERTTLSVTPPDAYVPQPEAETRAKP